MKAMLIGSVLAALVLAGCGGDDEPSEPSGSGSGEAAAEATETQAPTQPAPAPKPKGTKISLGDSQFGSILFGPKQQAIYLFDKEGGPKAQCYGECAAAWPPVLTKGEPRAGRGLKQSLLGTTQRKDGTSQVTYNGHPLYYYAHEGPGEVTCHDVEEFGGLWLVVNAAGDAV